MSPLGTIVLVVRVSPSLSLVSLILSLLEHYSSVVVNGGLDPWWLGPAAHGGVLR